MAKIALIGYGKMGQTIEKIALNQNHSIVYISDQIPNIELLKQSGAEVAIEFSIPEAAPKNLTLLLENKIPVVCGTTGWLDQRAYIESIALKNETGFIYASNFSLGVNLFFALNEYLAQLMLPYKDYKPVLTEIHHTQKLDAPSGTALSLAQPIMNIHHINDWSLVSDFDSNNENLQIKAIRKDPEPGTHIVNYSSPIDDITITHTAHTRDGFALGAVIAANWLVGKQGIFTMKDVLFNH